MSENAKSEAQQQREKFYDLVKSFKSVVLVTNAAGGSGNAPDGASSGEEFHSRPMAVARVDESCDLWFLTGADSGKIFEIREDPTVLIVAQDGQSRFISLTGTAHLHKDRSIIHELWSEPYKVWFPGGEEDPNIRIIHVAARGGEYWDSTGVNKVKYLLESAKAYATGTTPNTEEGEQHGKVRL